MVRQARRISNTGTYHIVFRGVNHCHLFEESEDYERFLNLFASIKADLGLSVYAYCLMSNHAHILINVKTPGDMVVLMRRLLGPYASWFNNKYQRSGALIADRYKSECVESDPYLLSVIRYIHQNPVIAGIVKRQDGYRWSSYCEYTKGRPLLADKQFVLELFSLDSSKAAKEFEVFHQIAEENDYSLPGVQRRSEEDVRSEMIAVLGDMNLHSIGSLQKPERDAMLSALRKHGFSIRQIERATGVSRRIVEKAYRPLRNER